MSPGKVFAAKLYRDDTVNCVQMIKASLSRLDFIRIIQPLMKQKSNCLCNLVVVFLPCWDIFLCSILGVCISEVVSWVTPMLQTISNVSSLKFYIPLKSLIPFGDRPIDLRVPLKPDSFQEFKSRVALRTLNEMNPLSPFQPWLHSQVCLFSYFFSYLGLPQNLKTKVTQENTRPSRITVTSNSPPQPSPSLACPALHMYPRRQSGSDLPFGGREVDLR